MKTNDRLVGASSSKISENPQIPESDWKIAQKKAVKQSLHSVTTWLAFLFVILSISHFFFLTPAYAVPLSLVTGFTAFLFIIVSFILHKFSLPIKLAHPLAALLISLTLMETLARMHSLVDIDQVIYLILIILGLSLFIIDRRWFIGILIVIILSFGITVFLTPGLILNSNYIPAIFISIGLAIIFHHFHRKSLKKLLNSEYQERIRKIQLEQTLEKMKQESEQLNLNHIALKAAANGIAITDRNAKFLWVNPAFTTITGYSSEEALGKHPNILKSGVQEASLYQDLWATILSGKVWSGNIINRRKDGTLYHEEQTITPVTDENGEITHFIGIKQDVTLRVQAQEALERRNRELIQLNKAISIITSSLDLCEVEQNIVVTVKQLLTQVYGATLQLLDEQGALVTRTITHYSDQQTPDVSFRPGIGITGIAVQERKIVNCGDVDTDARFIKRNFPHPFRSIISIPIIYKERIFGTLSVMGKIINAFGPQEERLLILLADYAAAAIQNALYSEHLEEIIEKRTLELKSTQEKLLTQQQIEQEIKLAVEVQESLLPHHTPRLPGFSIAAAAIPAHSVSGDFYDFVSIKGIGASLIVADIAGKGIPAAMLTSTARTLVRISSDEGQSPSVTLRDVNTRLYRDLTRAGMFITMLVAQINPDGGRVKYANAGHTEALWWHHHSQSCQSIPVTGIPLGILKEFDMEEIEFSIRPGDILLLYSDGITEATNPEDELFGVERLKLLIQENNKKSSEELRDSIIAAVNKFCHGQPQSDDITLVILNALPRRVPFLFPANYDQLDSISSLIRQNTDAFNSSFAYQVELATSEIVTNIMKHAYSITQGEIRGEISVFNDRIGIDFYDDGIMFDPSQLEEVDFDRPHEHGYGLFLVKQLMDEVAYVPNSPQGNHWHLVKMDHEGE